MQNFVFNINKAVPKSEFETSIMNLIRKTVANCQECEDEFKNLKCYEGFKYAFKILRKFNPKNEEIEKYSIYLLESLESCLQKVKISHFFDD